MNARTVQIVRSVSVLAGTAALIAGGTFAATNSTNTAKLQANAFDAGSGLQLSLDGTSWHNNVNPAFDFTGLKAEQDSAKHDFYIMNNSGGDLSELNVTSNTPTLTGTLPADVTVKLMDNATPTPHTVTTTLAALELGNVSLSGLTLPANGSSAKFEMVLNVTMDGDNVSASTSAWDLSFKQ
jgi:hypothetical protein